MVLSVDTVSESGKTASIFMTEDSFFLISIPIVFIGVFLWTLLGDDIKKEKIENLFLKGRSKSSIFLSKVVPLALLSGTLAMFLSLIPVLLASMLNGWGDIVDKSNLIFRLLLTAFPYLRLAGFSCLIILIFKNLFIIIFTTSAEIVVFGIWLSPVFQNSYIFGYTNALQLFARSYWISHEFSNQDGFVEVIGSSFPLSITLVIKTICISIFVVLVYMFICYYCFRKENQVSLFRRISYLLPIGIAYILFLVVKWNNLNTVSYSEEFDKAFNQLREHYVLSEEKRIDWDGLYNSYYPKFKDADRRSDDAENYKLWLQFCDEFNDGHVFFNQSILEKEDKNICSTFGNDYGLSLIKLASGEYVAFNVEGYPGCYSVYDEEPPYSCAADFLEDNLAENRLTLYNAGIHNGTVITKWDGIDIGEHCQFPNIFLQRFADKTNRTYYMPVYAAGYGGDVVTITFINDDGLEEQVSVNRLGAYACRLTNSLDRLDKGYDIENISWAELDERTVLLRLSAMNNTKNTNSEEIENFEVNTFDDISMLNSMKLGLMIEDVKSQVEEYEKMGKKNIIIDLRGNLGGDPIMSLELASLFAPIGNLDVCYSARINKSTACYERGTDGKYEKYDLITRSGKDLWHDGKIVILVNNETMSAGDIIAYLMAKFPNVTIMGITRTNSSSQATDTISIAGGSISYSAIPLLSSDGTALIDADYRQIGNVPIDVIIPTDETLIKAVFDEGRDYVLECAVEFFK